MEKHSAEWLRGWLEGAEVGVYTYTKDEEMLQAMVRANESLLAEAEAREASEPTAEDVIEAVKKVLKRVVGLDYMGDPEVAIHSFPNLKVTPMQAAEELYELRSLIAAWEAARK